MTKADYDAQQAVANRTIQYTVADTIDLPGVVPERVTDIIVEEEEEEEGGRISSRADIFAVSPVLLKYKIAVFDPTLNVELLRSGLMKAAQEGKMDMSLRFYAAQFGASSLRNGTFGEPQVTSVAAQGSDSSELFTGVQIALVVIGVCVGLALLAAMVWFALSHKQKQALPLPEGGDRVLDRA